MYNTHIYIYIRSLGTPWRIRNLPTISLQLPIIWLWVFLPNNLIYIYIHNTYIYITYIISMFFRRNQMACIRFQSAYPFLNTIGRNFGRLAMPGWCNMCWTWWMLRCTVLMTSEQNPSPLSSYDAIYRTYIYLGITKTTNLVDKNKQSSPRFCFLPPKRR